MKNNFNFFKAFLVSGVVSTASVAMNAQVNQYNFAQSNGTFAPITGTTLIEATGNASATNLNSNVVNVVLPFTFKFNNIDYTSLNVSTNGFVTFGATAPSTTTTSPISGSVAYDGAISVFGRDISSYYQLGTPSVTGKIQYKTEGTGTNQVFVIEWSNFRVSSSTSTTAAHDFSFQLRLEQGTNKIKMVYGPNSLLLGTSTTSSTVQVGLRGSTNADFANRSSLSTQPFGSSTVGTANGNTQYFSTATGNTAGMPASGLTYEWTPPTCLRPTNVTASNLTTNSITVNWDASTSAPLGAGYEVYYSTSTTAPDANTVPQVTNITGTSTTLSNLTALTGYKIWVRSACSAADKSMWTQMITAYTLCQPPVLAVAPTNTVCMNGAITLSATTDANATVAWYDAATGGNLLGTGSTYTTPALTSSTTYYAQSSTGEIRNVGKVGLESNAGTGGGTSSYMNFTANSDFVLKTVDVFPYAGTAGTAGTATIVLRDASGTTLLSKTVNVIGQNTVSASTPQTVTLDFPVTGGANYRLGIEGWTGISNMYRDDTNFTYPYSIPAVVDITGPGTAGYYYFFYNWQVETGCKTARQPVTVTVDTNCLSTTEAIVKDEVKVYPNPFVDIIQISNSSKVTSAVVVDASGRMVKSFQKVPTELNLGDLKSGMYILKLTLVDGSNQTIKVIKK